MKTIIEQYEAQVQNENWTKAGSLARQISELAPNDKSSWFNLGVCLDETNEHLDAAIAFQRFLLIEPDDQGAIFRMLRSYLLAGRQDILFEEMRTYSNESPGFVAEFAQLDAFQHLFSKPPFSNLLVRRSDAAVTLELRSQNLTALDQLGYSAPADINNQTGCQNTLRFLPEIGLRVLSLTCVYSYLQGDWQEKPIRQFMDEYSGESYLADDELQILGLPRQQSRENFGHIAGWYLERLLPLAWVLGFEQRLPPNGQPLQEQAAGELTHFVGELPNKEYVWDWLRRFQTASEQTIVQIHDLYYCAQVAIQESEAGDRNLLPENFDPVFNGGVVFERWKSLAWALTPNLPLNH